ncbi:MAG: hypothetical protein OEV73_00130 [Desulfobulbaceae bacterium]|nr:hypothetical protein [Desulfobulbaceae bacterium]
MIINGKQFIDWDKLSKVPANLQKVAIYDAVCQGFKAIAADSVKMVAAGSVQGQKIIGIDPNLVASGPPIVMVGSDTVESPDRGYEALFADVDMRASSNDTFEMLDISGGVTFYQKKTGEEAKLSRLPSSAKSQVGLLRFIGGFAIEDDWLRFNKYYLIDDLTKDTFNNWYNQKADLFYGLMAAMGAGINQAFATDDVTTINNACAAIVTEMEAAGYSVSAGSGFYITCHPILMSRIYKALAASFVNANSNNNQITYNIKGVIPTAKIASTSYYVSLPGLKNKKGEWEDLNARPAQRNELVLGADHVWTGAYNGAIGESKQHKRCALS